LDDFDDRDLERRDDRGLARTAGSQNGKTRQECETVTSGR
jgi:hypothetical protein